MEICIIEKSKKSIAKKCKSIFSKIARQKSMKRLMTQFNDWKMSCNIEIWKWKKIGWNNWLTTLYFNQMRLRVEKGGVLGWTLSDKILRFMLQELWFLQEYHNTIYEYNNPAIDIVNSIIPSERTRHIDALLFSIQG